MLIFLNNLTRGKACCIVDFTTSPMWKQQTEKDYKHLFKTLKSLLLNSWFLKCDQVLLLLLQSWVVYQAQGIGTKLWGYLVLLPNDHAAHPQLSKFSISSNFISQGQCNITVQQLSFPYQKLNEDSPSSSIWKGHLSSHCHHHTPLHCYLNPNLGRAQSCHCYCSFLHCVHHQTRSWSIAGSSCRQAEGRAKRLCCSGERREMEQHRAATHRAVAPGPAVSELCGIPLLWVASRLHDATWHHRGPSGRLPLWLMKKPQLQFCRSWACF